MQDPLITAKDLRCWYPVRSGVLTHDGGVVRAVDDVTLTIERGETLGLVGESGCGKTTLGHALLRLIQPTAGTVLFDGHDLARRSAEEMRRLRKRMQVIFQDPYSSLNPRLTIGSMLREALLVHHIVPRSAVDGRIAMLLTLVGLDPTVTNRHPHEFSSGQRQRIGIARALSVEPEFIVCDEPVSALDVSVQAQILNLLLDLKTRLHLTLLFITHDLSVVRHISDRIAVMYLGRIIEHGPADELWTSPQHPYTQLLMRSAPATRPELRHDTVAIASPTAPAHEAAAGRPTGCAFHPRCPHAAAVCREHAPELATSENGVAVACHLFIHSRPAITTGCRAGDFPQQDPS